MPQFEFYTFPAQNFYFLSFFCIIYFFIVVFYIPYISEILKMRQKLSNYYLINKIKKPNLIGIFYDIYFKKK